MAKKKAKAKSKAKPKPKTKPKTKKEVKEKKPTVADKKKSKSMGKRFRLIISVIVVICIVGAVWFTLNPDIAKAESKAQLVIESGTVQVKHAGGLWITAENGMPLYESDSVKTGDNTSASIILFESSIIRLDSNTEVTLQEIIQQTGENSVTIQQGTGRTWNTIQKISGIDDYEVQTPTAVASVRGTSFDVYILADGNTTVGVGNGTVDVSSIRNGTIIYTIVVNENWSVSIDPHNLNQPLIVQPFVQDGWVLQNLLEDDELREDIKEDLYNRIEQYIPQLKEEYGMTDEEIDALLDGYLKGYLDLPDEAPDWVREIFEFS